ncbi:MAG: hypothetical protein QGD94_00145 [Planctomycetia bacterium]|nr:hypothetical protein [Planctomycetia bacterium]
MRWITAVFGILAALGLGGEAEGVRTAKFVEADEKAFQKGETDGTVWTSLGKLRLARDVKAIIDEKAGVAFISALAEAPNGTIYAATGIKGEVYKVVKGKAEVLATLPDKVLFSITVASNGTLYVGSGGQKGRIFQVSPKGDVKDFFESEGIQYIWALLTDKKGNVYAATGPTGKVFKITSKGKSEVLFTSEEKHVLALVRDEKGNLYAGTDGAALVYRFSPEGKLFVLHDAAESEITALALDEAGNLFVGASSASGGRSASMSFPVVKPSAPAPAVTPSGGALAPSKGGEKDSKETPAKDIGDSPEKEKAKQPVSKKPSLLQSMTVQLHTSFGPGAGEMGPGGAPEGGAGENAIYKITPEGIVTPIFRSSDGMILALSVQGETVLAGTGGTKDSGKDPKGGRVYEIRLDTEEHSPLVTVDPKRVMSIIRSKDGTVVFGTAAHGKLFVMSKGFVKQGTYITSVYDAGASARWGNIRWRAQVPRKTSVTLSTRSGNVEDPKSGVWSNWSSAIRKSPGLVVSPTARFIQFRATLGSSDPKASPVLDEIEMAYLATNLAPKILRVMVDGAKEPAQPMPHMPMPRSPSSGPGNPIKAKPVRKITWQAQDPNGDKMRYDVWFRGLGEGLWILLKKDLSSPMYQWDTRTVSDGWYEVKVSATDAPDNPPAMAKSTTKVSEPVLVDNTAPEVRAAKARIAGGKVTVTAEVVDAASNITAARYVVDSGEVWQTLAPEGLIFDSKKEFLKFEIKDLEVGEHRIAIQAVDAAGNVGNAKITVEIKGK